MVIDTRQWTDEGLKKYIEPMLDQAKPDSWRSEYGYVYGWVGNPIVAALLMYKNELKKYKSKLADSERDLFFYKTRYEQAMKSALEIMGTPK